MKHRIRKLTSLLLSLSLISALTLPAAASNALGEDLSAKDSTRKHSFPPMYSGVQLTPISGRKISSPTRLTRL